jgi:hypothetical protein
MDAALGVTLGVPIATFPLVLTTTAVLPDDERICRRSVAKCQASGK